MQDTLDIARSRQAGAATPAVRIDRVSKRFGTGLAVDDVSFDVAADEFVSLVGPSGCGKSTLLRIVSGLIEASADLGARDAATFRKVIFPLALPGIVAGSIFTFSLTLGDYIIPGIIGDSSMYIGQVVYLQQGTAGNVPLAAAFTLVPITVMAVYLAIAKRMGAFDAL